MGNRYPGRLVKVRAMTIMELCIVMLLSAIVTGIVFTTLDISEKSIRKFKKDASAISDLNLLRRLLEQDIWKCRELLFMENSIQTAGPTGIAAYHFNPDFIIREKDGSADTFAFPNQNLAVFFEKQPLEIKGMLADRVSFDLIYKEQLHNFTFSKIYGADILMNHDKNLNPNGWH